MDTWQETNNSIVFELSYLIAITNDFSKEQRVGGGSFADVYKAVHDGEEIAVERFHQLQGLDDKPFVNQCRILIGVNHPNVIRLVGYCHETRRLFVEHSGELIFAAQLEQLICYEYQQGGSLDKYIGDDSCELDWPTCHEIIKGTCEGLNHLHNDQKNPILHLDLKPSNILLDTNMTPKITGFHLSRSCRTSASFKTVTMAGTHGYMAPEYRNDGILSSKTDIYSLGVIIIKVLAGQGGVARLYDMAQKEFIDHVIENIKLPQASRSALSYEIAISQVKKCFQIALKCMEVNRDKRPYIMDILHELGGPEFPQRKLGGPEATVTMKISRSHAKDQRRRMNGLDALDDLVHDVSAEAIKLPFEVLRKITKNFADERKIGKGGFGTVYKGVLQTGSVAVKKLWDIQTIDEKTFDDEADFLMGFRHQNIVRFLGYCAHTERVPIAIKQVRSGGRQKYTFCEMKERLLCFEYLSNGDLNNHITDELSGLEWHTRYEIIKGICEGLQYLHRKGIAHLDLKPANVLLDDFMVPKITDFGTSRDIEGISRGVTKNRPGTLGYSAPEYLYQGQVSVKADIFSLGVIIKDIVTGRKEDIDHKNVLRRWRYRWNKSAKYPPLGYQQISKCIEIARKCLVEEPRLRPHLSDIIKAQSEIENANEHITNADESMVGQISPYSWELLEINPLELNFPFKPNKLIQSSVILNNERDDYIAFDIQKPRKTLDVEYFVEPNKGIMPPHSRNSVTVTFQASERAPEYMLCGNNFVVRCTVVDDKLTAANINEDVFDAMLGKVVDKVMLTVAFT